MARTIVLSKILRLYSIRIVAGKPIIRRRIRPSREVQEGSSS